MTLMIVIFTVIVSIMAFSNNELMSKLIFNPYMVSEKKQWFRFFSSGFIHADWIHLFVNMFVLFSFGKGVEIYYGQLFPEHSTLYFMLLYLGAMLFSITPSYAKHKHDMYYNALGASGAVSAVLFTYILLDPLQPLYLYGIIKVPGILVGIGYVIYEYQMGKRGGDNINHDAHLWGAGFGIAFTLLLKPSLFLNFIDRLTDFNF